jgi:hypothetical protein
MIQGKLRPDLVIVKNNKATIINNTVLFENRMEVMNEARQQKLHKYQDLARALCTRFLVHWDPGTLRMIK